MAETENHAFPRILILNSQSLNKNNATGITLRSVFSCIPKEKMLQVYRFKPWNPVTDGLDVNSIQIPPTAMPISYLFKKMFGAATDEDKKPSIVSCEERISAKLSVFKALFKAILDNSILMPDRTFLEKIDLFKPECIYTLGGGICIQKWALFFAKRYNCKVVMHYMDNWRQTAYMDDSRLAFLNKYLNRQLNRLEKNMKCGMVISEAMAEAYKELYHHDYIPLMNTVEGSAAKKSNNEALTIVYAGGLHLNRYKTLLEVENAIKMMSHAKLVIYTSKENIDAYQDFFQSELTTFKLAVKHEDIGTVYDSADILLHVESFDKSDIEYTKYSLSTKIPEYMMSGKPIICYAPLSIAASRYIQSSKAGISVESPNELLDALKMLSEEKIRYFYGSNGIAAALNNHSRQSTVRVLTQVFAPGD